MDGMDQNSEDSDGKRRDINGRIDPCTGRNINPLLWGEYGEAVRMIINGECGAFSMKLLQCFLAAAMQKEWVQKVETDTEA